MKSTPQSGILNRPPEHALVVSLNLLTADPTSTGAALERLRELTRKEQRSKLDPVDPAAPQSPPAETGELGFESGFDRQHLTITAGFALGAYEKLGIDPAERPQDLTVVNWDALGDTGKVRNSANGDVCLQVCADSTYIVEHVLRRIEEELGDVLAVAWVVDGHQRYSSRAGRTSREEGRALIGFKDGTSNLRPKDEAADRALVFVNPDEVAGYPQLPQVGTGQPGIYGSPTPPTMPADLRSPPAREPEHCREGTYMVVRASTFDTTPWDDLPLAEQEAQVGRRKVTGNALDTVPDVASHPPTEPNFVGDPDGMTTRLSSHVRKTHPREPGDEMRRIFRRGYPLLRATDDGRYERGLTFVCFARSISTQFEFITRAWTANPDFPRPGTGLDPLRTMETAVICGGYFFVPPLAKANQPWSWTLPALSSPPPAPAPTTTAPGA